MKRLNLRTLWQLIVQTYNEFIDDKGFKMAASLSYYAAFSIGPLLIIIIAIAGFIFGDEAARGEIFKQINYLIGADGAVMIETILKGAADKSTGVLAAVFSITLLVLGSIGVFIELQESLNIIWGVEPRPGRGLWGFIKTRLVSFSMVITTGFLLIVSLLINTIITLLSNFLAGYFDLTLPIAEIMNQVASFVVITIMLSLIFRYLPDVIIPTRISFIGAIITSVLFAIGKYLIGLYLGGSSYTSTYGAAASLVVLFVWIYYSGVILFFGAEFTQVYMKHFGKIPLRPDRDGVIIPKVSQLVKDSIRKQH